MYRCFANLPAVYSTLTVIHNTNSLNRIHNLLKRIQMYAYKPFPETLRRPCSTENPNEKKILVAFDFDHTIADGNSDLVIRGLAPKGTLSSAEEVHRNTDSWTLYMREIFCCLHKSNISKEQIVSAIHNIPPIKCMNSLIKLLDNSKFEVIINSDSNSVFISEWLKTQKLDNIIRKVITNPAWFDSNNLLNIEYYQSQSFCELSEHNLCKGHALETYMSDRKIDGVLFDHIVYIGDGSNDYCPTLKLSEKDYVFPRLNYPLFKRISKNKGLVKAQVHPWNDGSDVIKVFQEKFELGDL